MVDKISPVTVISSNSNQSKFSGTLDMFGDCVVTTRQIPSESSSSTIKDKSSIWKHNHPGVNHTGSNHSGPKDLTFNRFKENDKLRTSSESSSFEEVPERRRASALVDQLLCDIYRINSSPGCNTTGSYKSLAIPKFETGELVKRDTSELRLLIGYLQDNVCRTGNVLVRQLKRRDALRRQRDTHCDVISHLLRKRVPDLTNMRFSIEPAAGDSSFAQWHSAMKMVARLPEGIPPEFRKRLWLALADRHLSERGIDWERVERNCFSEWSHPADADLGVQIVKDLHRTGCSLFCGEDGQENQALLKRVLLAYARWNKSVGYCQGFNMLAALILQVTEKRETDALKLMIYLIEGVLPDSYFADSLRGLSVDMAVFRELLRTRLPKLSKHLDTLQSSAKDGTKSYEPPLTNVFTMQWFLTLFCNCLPQDTVLRVWDLIMLEGNEILLRTALAIWQALEDRILTVRSADEFYCIMGVLTREMLEFGLVNANALIKAVVQIGHLKELKTLRDHYLYNINPWGNAVSLKSYNEGGEEKVNTYSKEKLALDIGVLKKQYTKLKERQRQAHIIFTTAINKQPETAAPVAMNHLLLGKSALGPAKRPGPPKGAIPPARQPVSAVKPQRRTRSPSSSSSSDTELCDEPEQVSEEEASELRDEVVGNSRVEDLKTPTENTNVNKETMSSEISSNEDRLVISLNEPVLTDRECNQEVEDLLATNSNQHSNVDSEDDSTDFENFLEERILALRQQSKDDGAVDDLDRVQSARKNTDKALQIINENSIILTRILQCQSRLSPSPTFLDSFPLSTSSSSSTVQDCSRRSDEEKDEVSFPETTFLEVPSTSGDTLLDISSVDSNLEAFLTQKPAIGNSTVSIDSPPSELFPSKEPSLIDFDEEVTYLPKKINDNLVFDDDLSTSDRHLCIADFEGNAKDISHNVAADSLFSITSQTQKTSGVTFREEENLSDAQTKSPTSKCSQTILDKINSSQGNIDEANKYLRDYRNKQDKTSESSAQNPTDEPSNSPSEAQGSKYSSILEYSKTLNERYNNLILRTEQNCDLNYDASEKFATSSPTVDDFETKPPEEYKQPISTRGSKERTDEHEESEEPTEIQKPKELDKHAEFDKCKELDERKEFDKRKEPEKVKKSKEPNTIDNADTLEGHRKLYEPKEQIQETEFPEDETKQETSGLKTLNKIYNPFPVKYNLRQNKDVAVKLGLYKK